MKLIETLLPAQVVEAFGWMILHSLWQGAVISVFLGLIMILTNKFSAKSRYFIAVAAFLFMPVVSVFTFLKNYQPLIAVQSTRLSALTMHNAPAFQMKPDNEQPPAIGSVTESEKGLSMKEYRKYFSQHIPLIVTIWFLGMLVFALKFLGGLAYIQRLKHYRIHQVTEEWQKTFDKLCKTIHIQRAVKIVQSAMVKVPMVIGFFKPVVLIPVSTFTGIPSKQLEIIIMHELAHIIRRDYIINILQSLVEIIFFFHPAVWWMSKVIRTEREHCCDDIAIEKTGDSLNFAKALANIQEQFLLKESLAMSIHGGKNNLFKRIKRLISQPTMKTSFTEGFTASCIIFTGIFIMMINIGASRNLSFENPMLNENPSKKEVAINVDDSTKISPVAKKEKPATVEDQLFELENKEKVQKSNQKDEQTEELQKEAEKAQLEAEMKQTEAEKANQYAERKKDEAEKARKETEKQANKNANSGHDNNPTEDEILKGVEAGLKDMDLNKIAKEAMDGAQAGISQIDLNAIVKEAVDGVNEGISEIDANLISNEILSGIQSAVQEMDLNLIAGEVLSGIKSALQEIDVNKIVNNQVSTPVPGENFTGNPEHLSRISKGVGDWNKWRNDNPKVTPDLRGALLTEANLNSADLHNALLDNIDMKEAVLDWANLEGASLRYALLKEATFNGTKLSNADFMGTNLKEVNLSGQNLRNTNFSQTNLKEADLSLTDFRDSDLSYANIREADFTKADLRNANLKGADLSEAKISGVNFKGAIADKYTQFPEGFNAVSQGIEIKN